MYRYSGLTQCVRICNNNIINTQYIKNIVNCTRDALHFFTHYCLFLFFFWYFSLCRLRQFFTIVPNEWNTQHTTTIMIIIIVISTLGKWGVSLFSKNNMSMIGPFGINKY